MIQLNKKPDEPGRNEKCSCGSGKKYKKCCGKPIEINAETLLKCLFLLVAGAPNSQVVFFSRAINSLPENWMDKMKTETGKLGNLNGIKIRVEHEKKLIAEPSKKLVLPGDERFKTT